MVSRRALRAQGILGGLSLERDYPELRESVLVCVTETKDAADLVDYAGQVARILDMRLASSALQP